MTSGTLEIHGQNILPIIKRWLYSDKDIFLRELVSNACDAIAKRKVLHERNMGSWQEPRIDVRIDKTSGQIIIEDTGLGMDESDLVRYLSQVAFSSAEEFLSHYEGTSRDQIIGHFGLGFYSAFMVSSLVEVESLSCKEGAVAAKWSCEGGVEYNVQPIERTLVGTKITLTIADDSREYLDSNKLEEVLRRYTRFLPYTIYLNDRALQPGVALWLRSPKECSEQDYLDFYHQLYPGKSDPLFWIHLDVDHPFRLKGILYFPHKEDLRDSTDAIQLYCNRVFVSEGCRDILPTYLLPLHGAIDSPDLPLNVSRSALQMDRSVRQLSAHIAKKVADKLKEIYQNERERFERVWPDIEVIVKWGALEDEKFYERIHDFILWKNDKDQWTTVQDYLNRCESRHSKKIFYGLAEHLHAPCMKMYKQQNFEVLVAGELIDPSFFSHLEKKLSVQFRRIDAELDSSLLDATRESQLLDENGQTASTRLAKSFEGLLQQPDNLQIEAKSLSDDTLPAILTLDEQQRRFFDYMARRDGKQQIQPPATLIINSNNPLIQTIDKLIGKDPELAKRLGTQVVDLAKLSQQSLDPNHKQHVVEKTWDLLQELTSKLV